MLMGMTAAVARTTSSTRASTRPRVGPTAGVPPGVLSSLALGTLLLGAFLSMADFFIVNVALGDIQTSLHASAATLEMVVTGYGVVYALLLVAGGRLGDAVGRKPMFVGGMAAFTVASLACGLAPTAPSLVAMRVVQGASAAMMVPQVLATVQATTTGQRRLRALGWFGATAGMAAVVGQVVGGYLVSADLAGAGWRPIFLVNIPVGLVGLALAVRVVPDSRSATPARHDRPGTALLGVALLSLLVPLMEGRVYGWPAWSWLSLAVSAVAFTGFVVVERRLERRGGVPLVPLTLVRMPSMARGLVMVVLFFGGFGGFMFVYTVTAQVGLGLKAIDTGLLLAPMAGTFLLASLVSPRLVVRLDRSVITIGLLLQAAGLGGAAALMAGQWPEVSLVALASTLALAGFGQGMVASPLFGTVLSHVPPSSAGAGSGVLTTTQQSAMALGIATLGNLFLHVARDPAKDMGRGFATVLVIQVAIALVVAGLSRTLPRRVAA
jgi:MFS family permease